jgi:hypothetical protein
MGLTRPEVETSALSRQEQALNVWLRGGGRCFVGARTGTSGQRYERIFEPIQKTDINRILAPRSIQLVRMVGVCNFCLLATKILPI